MSYKKNLGVVKIGGKEYDVIIARSEKLKSKGLQGLTHIDDDEGMLFINDEPEDVWYHMKNVLTDLEMIFMDDNMKVILVSRGKANDPTPIEAKGVKFVLEIAPGSEIKPGEEADIEDEETEYVMSMLAPDGSCQFEMLGGERIFSRKSTKTMIRKAIKAERTKEDKDYKALGRYVLKEIYAQDHRDPEYVQSPV